MLSENMSNKFDKFAKFAKFVGKFTYVFRGEGGLRPPIKVVFRGVSLSFHTGYIPGIAGYSRSIAEYAQSVFFFVLGVFSDLSAVFGGSGMRIFTSVPPISLESKRYSAPA
jgi:hypothetical protein